VNTELIGAIVVTIMLFLVIGGLIGAETHKTGLMMICFIPLIIFGSIMFVGWFVFMWIQALT
jgi:predicted membrane protein